MNMSFESKIMTAAEAVKSVRSGDRVYVGTASSFAYELMDALWERKDELSDVTILCSLSTKPSRIFGTKWEEGNPFRIMSFFMGPWERIASRKNGVPLDYTSFHLSQVDLWCREIAKADVCFMEMSRPDAEGYLSFGPSGCCLYTYLLETARAVYVESNARTPFVRGDRCTIHYSKVDGIVMTYGTDILRSEVYAARELTSRGHRWRQALPSRGSIQAVCFRAITPLASSTLWP